MATIRQTWAYLLATSGIFLFVGCSAWDGGYKGGTQLESTQDMHSKSLAGAYRDVGSDGSIKSHPAASDPMSRNSQSR
ncbi:MAG: hypothetical protein JSR29_18010 [Nitrospira sp.]|nr:hypothetical protein [Nitrospira sp.]